MSKMYCPSCGTDLYWSGHDDYECPGAGEGCQECGWGCDLDFVEDGVCAGLRAAEDDDESDGDEEDASDTLAGPFLRDVTLRGSMLDNGAAAVASRHGLEG